MAPTKILAFLLSLVSFATCWEKMKFKSEWDEISYIPKQFIIVQSENYPTRLVVEPDDVHYEILYANVRRFVNGRSEYECYIPMGRNASDKISSYELVSGKNGIEVLTYQVGVASDVVTEVFVIDMKTCEFDHLALSSKPDAKNQDQKFVSVHDDTVDLFLSSHDLCTNYVCRWRYNITSKNWSEPVPFPALDSIRVNNKFIKQVQHVADGESYLFSVKNIPKWVNFLLVNSADVEINRMTDWVEPDILAMRRYALSTEHESIGLCYMIDVNKINCTLKNAKFDTLFSIGLNFQHPVSVLKTYNTVDGRLLLVIGHCNGDEDCLEFVIELLEILLDGSHLPAKEYARLSSQHWQLNSLHPFAFFEENGELCTRYVCDVNRLRDNTISSMVVKCF